MRTRGSMLAIAALAACSSTSTQQAATAEAAAQSISSSAQPAPVLSPAASPLANNKATDVFVQNTADAPVITRKLDSSTDSVAIAQPDGASWKVAVASLPPISINPAGNTVRLPSTALIADETRSAGLSNSPQVFGPYDVSAYSRVRIMFHNGANSDPSFILQGFLIDPANIVKFADLNSANTGDGTFVLEVPTPQIEIALWQFNTGSTVRVLVYGSSG